MRTKTKCVIPKKVSIMFMLLLSFILVTSISVTMGLKQAYSAEESETLVQYNVWIGETQITNENMNDVMGDKTITYTPANGIQKATLTLNGANIIDYKETNPNRSTIFAEEELIVVIKGTNTITTTTQVGIESTCPLYIQGEGAGTLNISAECIAIFGSTDMIRISGLDTLNVSNKDKSFSSIDALDGLTISDCKNVIADNGFDSGNEDLILQNGDFDITTSCPRDEEYAYSDAVFYSSGNITIRNAFVEITPDASVKNNYEGMYAQFGVDISAGTKVIINDSYCGICGGREGVNIQDSSVLVTGVLKTISTSTSFDGVISMEGCSFNEEFPKVKVSDDGKNIVNASDDAVANLVYIVPNGEPEKHNVSVTVNNSNYGSINILGYDREFSVIDGAAVTLSAKPSENCHFIGWRNGGTFISSDMEISVVVTDDMNIVADFGEGILYEIKVCGVQITSINMKDVLGDGKVSYTPANGTTPAILFLNSANLIAESRYSDPVEADEHLIIDVRGTNIIKSEYSVGIFSNFDIYLQSDGTGSLTIESSSFAIQSASDTVQISGLKELNLISGVGHSMGSELNTIYTYRGLTIKDCDKVTANNSLYSGNGGDEIPMCIDNSSVYITMPSGSTSRTALHSSDALYIQNGSYVQIESADDTANNTYNGIKAQFEIEISDSIVIVKDAIDGILSQRRTIDIDSSRVYVTASECTMMGYGDKNDPSVYYITLKDCEITLSNIKFLNVIDERSGWSDYTEVVFMNTEEPANMITIGMTLNEIEILELSVPYDGAIYDKSGIHKGTTPDRATYRFNNSSWYDVTNSCYMSDGDVFKAGNVYRYQATIAIKDDGCDLIDLPAENVNVILKDFTEEYTVVHKSVSSYQLAMIYRITIVCPETCTVSFTTDKGTGTMEAVTGVYGKYTLPVNKFTAPDGYKFKAWAIGSRSGEQKQPGEQVNITENTSIYAVWEKSGLCIGADGKWYYYTNGVVNTSYTGMAKNAHGVWYVKNGMLDRTYTGMCLYGGKWIYVNKGKYDTTYTGMAKNSAGWWYIKAGNLDRTYTGMAKNSYGVWYMKEGKLDTTYTGMCLYNGKWIYVNKGKYDTTYTGMARNFAGWWYMKNGVLDRTYTGMAKNSYGVWYMKAGKLDRSFTGMCLYNGKWVYVNAGRYDTTYTGVAKNSAGWWYMKNGVLDRTYTGKVTYQGKTYNVIKGKVAK